ncbi:MAG: hypothetical protein IIC67_06585, partial [Thaumarchaeota archaeon]|nr:hypothetical protein [Nitrososphaerota archaeon]
MSVDDIEDEIHLQEIKQSELDATLKNNLENIESDFSEISDDTKSELIRFDTKQSVIKSNIKIWKTRVVNSATSLIKISRENFLESAHVAVRVSQWFVSSIIFFSVGFIALFFSLFYQNPSEGIVSINGLNLNEHSLIVIGSVALLDLILIVIIKLGIRSIKKKISNISLEINENIEKIHDTPPDISDGVFETENMITKLLKRFPELDSKIQSITRDSRAFIKIVDSVYSAKTLRNSQVQYRRSMENALGVYGLYDNPADEIKREIENLSTPSDTEHEWVDSAAPKISNAFLGLDLEIDAKLIKVMYDDYTNSANLFNEWSDVVKDEVLCRKFAHLLSSRVIQTDVSGSYDAFVGLIQKLDPFHLKDFQQDFYDFFVDYESKKSRMKEVASFLEFSSDVKSTIDLFFPSSSDRDN